MVTRAVLEPKPPVAMAVKTEALVSLPTETLWRAPAPETLVQSRPRWREIAFAGWLGGAAVLAGLRLGAAGSALVALVAVTSATRESRASEPAVVAQPQAGQTSESEAAARARARVKEVRAKIEQARKGYEALHRESEDQRKKVEQLADQLLAFKESKGISSKGIDSLDERKARINQRLKLLNEEANRAMTPQVEDELRQAKAESLEVDRLAIQYQGLDSNLKINEQILRSIAARARATAP